MSGRGNPYIRAVALPTALTLWRDAGRWSVVPELPTMRRMRGLRLGLIGLGRIGLQVATRARGFGWEVVASDPFVDRQRVAGIIDFGFMFQRYEVLTNAAREGARMATLPGYSDADVVSRVESYLVTSGLTDTHPTPIVTPGTMTVGTCTVNTRTVTVMYHSQWTNLGSIAALVGGSGWSSITLRARSTMRLETQAVGGC